MYPIIATFLYKYFTEFPHLCPRFTVTSFFNDSISREKNTLNVKPFKQSDFNTQNLTTILSTLTIIVTLGERGFNVAGCMSFLHYVITMTTYISLKVDLY